MSSTNVTCLSAQDACSDVDGIPELPVPRKTLDGQKHQQKPRRKPKSKGKPRKNCTGYVIGIAPLMTVKPTVPSSTPRDTKEGASAASIAPSVSAQSSFVDTQALMVDCLDACVGALTAVKKDEPTWYIDLEGVRLSRYGSVSILQVYVPHSNHVYLIDVNGLGTKAFSTACRMGHTLKSILEDSSVIKAFFDVRNDSDALYAHFQVRLQGVYDIQSTEFATRCGSFYDYVWGLAKCIEYHCMFGDAEKDMRRFIKEKGRALFAPECGGSYEVFNERPLSKDIWEYCVQDVTMLPTLWKYYNSRLRYVWKETVRLESEHRVQESQSEEYCPDGKDKCRRPWDAMLYYVCHVKLPEHIAQAKARRRMKPCELS